MRAKRGKDTWFSSLWRLSFKAPEAEKGVIGILAFEVAGLMLKLVKLWHCLSDLEILKLREEISNSVGIRKLVSEDEDYLMNIALDEVIRCVVCVARSVVRLGKRCTEPAYHRLEHFFLDPVGNSLEWFGWEYRWKKMNRKMKKMERFAGLMLQLIQEEEILLEQEQTLRRMKVNPRSEKFKICEFQQKVMLQRQEVRNIRDLSPWNRSYDYTVHLLTRSIFTILERLSYAFGMDDPDDCVSQSHSFSAMMQSSVHPSEYCYSLPDRDRMTKALAHMGPLRGMGCIHGGIDSPVVQRSDSTVGESARRASHMSRIYSRLSVFYSNHGAHAPLAAPPHTLGGAALAVHYADVIVLIEKLASSPPHMIGLDARDDLYNMLPFSIRAAIRARLKFASKALKLSIYDAALATEWSTLLAHVLGWLAPLAHNTIKWQNEQNIEEQQVVLGANVLLVQTLFFADRAKTEAAITELLVGLSYLSRFHEVLPRKEQ
ncbi:uncharacterized protein LOC116195183 [Punica granatum]|uniref:DUF668 domain-containing protein n=2 Tax=Punica granatum TaxID=22663 RepID=A0A218WAX2_PUNGR|nr:uncharacterized protein LOC116195183 [Punica granatum]OWM69649.1 hypothetical protein CDL15_Pgr025498 [Punica granatum]PKI57672.1 hypothetical protein CRG98_022000 [Punica granatum]